MNRSYRRFDQGKKIERSVLEELVGLARISGSGANLQPLRFAVCADEEVNEKIFPFVKWAGYLTDWDGPKEGEHPAAYILILRDKEVKDIASKIDAGIQLQSIMLGAVEKGLGGCVIASFNTSEIMKLLDIDENRYEAMLLLTLGVPKEEVVLDEIAGGEDIKYYRDANNVHHVPKIRLADLLVN